MPYCNSCKKDITNLVATKFPCPNCLNFEIIRCDKCKISARSWICENCRFEGP